MKEFDDGEKQVHDGGLPVPEAKEISTEASSISQPLPEEKLPDGSVNNDHEAEDQKSEEEKKIEYPKGLRLLAIVVALCLSIFLVSLDLTIVATAIPKITDEFHGISDVSWYSAAFFMTIGGFQSAWGKAYKYFPLKTAFLVSIAIFELGSLICGVAPNSVALIVGRAIAGLGAAGIASGAYILIAFSAEPKARPMFTGIIGTSYGLAGMIIFPNRELYCS